MCVGIAALEHILCNIFVRPVKILGGNFLWRRGDTRVTLELHVILEPVFPEIMNLNFGNIISLKPTLIGGQDLKLADFC